jgi:hypothetical protein
MNTRDRLRRKRQERKRVPSAHDAALVEARRVARATQRANAARVGVPPPEAGTTAGGLL